ncbi:MAG: DM13 domain-containing protein, partial [Nitrosopumilus sp.]
WWADGIITNTEFLNNIQYLIANGIITISGQSSINNEIEVAPVLFEASGKFADGDFFHRTSGIASIEYSVKTGGILNFDNKFSTVLGPDLFVYLATDKSASNFVNVGRLQSSSGEQSYIIPAEIDLEKYDNVLVWCESFGVLFGNAQLSN